MIYNSDAVGNGRMKEPTSGRAPKGDRNSSPVTTRLLVGFCFCGSRLVSGRMHRGKDAMNPLSRGSKLGAIPSHGHTLNDFSGRQERSSERVSKMPSPGELKTGYRLLTSRRGRTRFRYRQEQVKHV